MMITATEVDGVVYLFCLFNNAEFYYLYCCTMHLVDSLIITQPTNAIIVCHLFLNH